MSKRLKRLQKRLSRLPEDDQLSALMEASQGTVPVDELEEYIRTH